MFLEEFQKNWRHCERGLLKRIKGQKTPWVSKELLYVRNECDYHHRKARSINSAFHWDMYEKLCNYSNRENR